MEVWDGESSGDSVVLLEIAGRLADVWSERSY